jgi:hypothetical protein
LTADWNGLRHEKVRVHGWWTENPINNNLMYFVGKDLSFGLGRIIY